MRDDVAHKAVKCPVCAAAMTQRNPDWWHVCGACGMQASTLQPAFDDTPMEEMFDWEQRETAFAPLRQANAEKLLDRLEKVAPPPARLLDVGCAEGWFVQAACARGYEVQGLEPDERMARKADKTLNIRAGFFPDALGRAEGFDIIVFNDVFEHLPDVRAAMRACEKHLAPKGILVINFPNALGGIYRLSCVAARLGFSGPFRRMWQQDYPSPHLTYFTPATLLTLAESAGLGEKCRFALPAMEPAELWARIRCDRSRSLAYSIAAWTSVMGAMPLLAMMPSDISVQMFAKTARNGPARRRKKNPEVS